MTRWDDLSHWLAKASGKLRRNVILFDALALPVCPCSFLVVVVRVVEDYPTL